LTPARTLHVTNGDSAAVKMNEARIIGDILPWRDVLHDGPLPPSLSLGQMSRVRARYLTEIGWAGDRDLGREFFARDAVVERYIDYEGIVLWFEWDLYDQLQLLQLLDFFGSKLGTREDPLKVEMVSFAGYLGTLPIEQFQELNNQRQPVTVPMMMLGRSAWRAITSADPREIEKLRATDTSSLPFLGDALKRFLEELPWTSDGLARSERQLLEALDNGTTTFAEVFDYATNREDRIYCGDASAALYLHRLASGSSPLVSIQANDSEAPSIMTATLGVTDNGRKVLQGERDWITLGGSDRWLGGVHLEGPSAKWRWNSGTQTVTTSLPG
jgi:hypothetical protein